MLFILLCFPLFLFSLFLASPFFTFSFFVSLLLFSFFLASCFSFLFLVLAFCFCCVCFFVSRCYFVFVFFCLLSCFVLNHNLRFVIALHLVFLQLLFLFCCFHILLFLIFGYLSSKNISENFGNCKNKNENAEEKTDILTRAVSTRVLTKSVFCVS